ncbi:LysR family transcriptional regulator [Pseudoalteromonas phenolica]|uniref:LysR family transcriptional regulator n=1 Tax=Pseudoalteromonas phenolica TaxID=161398 RepID=UPI001F4FE53F|nr:LysR family transcriptional regulator [Pseudoalteromonas phenolica]
MNVSLPALKAFESAARLGSFKAAATELAISPTAVSHHINNLEQRLSVNLFIRETRKVTLTATGRQLADATNQGFNIIQAGIDKVTAKDNLINVATTSSFAALVLIPALHHFYQQYPQITVNITSGEQLTTDNFTLPVRFGIREQQNQADIIKCEQFNLFSAPHIADKFINNESVTIYTTKWKNNALPNAPLEDWLALNALQDKHVVVKYFDQELFGIQQAMLENAYVFCSYTLTQGYRQAGLLAELNTQAIDSAFCYYIENKQKKYY